MRLAEEVWALGFTIAGRAARPRVERWSSAGGQRALVIAPHPDDEAIGCAGAIVRHKQCGDEVGVVFVSDGRRSRALGLGADEMARRRREEAARGARVLGVDWFEWLGLREGEWDPAQLDAPLMPLLRRFAPQVIYAPSRIDFHPEHRRVAHALARLLDAGQVAPALVRVVQVQVPLTPVLTNLILDSTAITPSLTDVLKEYPTQRASLGAAHRLRRYAACYYGAGKSIEEFWQLSAREYARLHQADPQGWTGGRFRSLRQRSFSDPLAYLIGWRERKRLKS